MNKLVQEGQSIDRKARMKLQSKGFPLRPAGERVCDFEDALDQMDADRARHEAARCIHCPDPAPCYKVCPAHNDISKALWLIEQGEFNAAAAIYRKTSSMPEICGRVCPHDQLCQGACVRNKNGEPVLTGLLESFVTEFDRRTAGVEIPVPYPTGRKVAVIGAGPAGLTCAEQLVRRGHWVTIFDSKPTPGGLLIYGIPNFKLPKSIVASWCQDLERAGVKFIGNTTIGKTKTINQLFADGYEAVFVGAGAGVDAAMGIPGENLPGIYKATEFLIRTNVAESMLPPGMPPLSRVGKHVVVIGGGDTASDCLRSALRLRAERVTCLYRRTENEMPGNTHDRQLAREEGAQFHYLTQPVEFIAGKNGRLAQVACIRMELGEPDERGRRRPVPVENSNFIVEADTAVLALGYSPDPIIGATTPGLRTHKWGLIISDPETGTTSRMGVFVGGDIVTGPNMVVTAMVAGRKAAVTIDAYLY
ncbi:MAG: FAD-dependent oxidoreductase [Omnitrophica WOR_2 bacterium]